MNDQLVLLSIVVVMITLFISGKWRHDLVALGCLIACIIAGLVPASDAFQGFGHPAVITVACVLILSQGLTNTGVIDVFARRIIGPSASPTINIAALMMLGAVLSAFMNNVGAMALLMPVAIKLAARNDLPPGKMLMPLAFATILGGMTTMIGTPPNLIVAGFRAELSDSFGMFDFTPVGLSVAVTCIVFLALLGWRMVPARQQSDASSFDTGTYLAELQVLEGSKAAGRTIAAVQNRLDESDGQIVGMVRNEFRVLAPTPNRKVLEGDLLIIEADPESLSAIISLIDVALVESDRERDKESHQEIDKDIGEERSDEDGPEREKRSDASDEADLSELVAMPNSSLVGRTAEELSLGPSHGLNLLAITRQGRRSIKRLRYTAIQAGDVMLLQGSSQAIGDFTSTFGAVPLAERAVSIPDRKRASAAVVILLGAIALSAIGALPAVVAFAGAMLIYGLAGIIRPRNLYDVVDWPVIVLLAALLPVAGAMTTTGAADEIANAMLNLFAGDNAVIALTLVLVVTMTLSDFMNNAATAAVMCPIAIGVANQLGVSPDSFLMAVAIGASCAMLTPIGHQNNTLILGPGGFRFGDYWRVGLPLEILVVVISVPMLLLVWPLG